MKRYIPDAGISLDKGHPDLFRFSGGYRSMQRCASAIVEISCDNLVGATLQLFWVDLLSTADRNSHLTPLQGSEMQSIESGDRKALFGIWRLAIFWCLAAFPLAFLVVRKHPETSLLLFVIGFALAGVFILYIAIRNTWRLARHGDVVITVTPPAPRLGASIQVQPHLSATAPVGEYLFRILCEQARGTGDDVRTRICWQQERLLQVPGSTVTITFEIPAHLPPTRQTSDSTDRWKIVMRYPNSSDERIFGLNLLEPISASAPATASREAVDSHEPPMPVPQTVASVRDEFSRLIVSYDPRRVRGEAITCSAFAAAFCAISLMCLRSVGVTPKLFALLFSGLSAGLTLGAVYLFTHRRVVEVSRQKLIVSERWLFGSEQQSADSSEVRHIVQHMYGIWGSSTQSIEHFRIRAILAGDREVLLGSGIKGAGIACTLAELFCKHIQPSEGAEPLQLGVEENGPRFERMVQRYHLRSWPRPTAYVLIAIFFAAYLWDLSHGH